MKFHYLHRSSLKNDLYDYGARMYDPVIGRFNVQDAFSEKYSSMTPYHYGANNPVLYIDVNGDSLWINFKNDRILYENGNLLNADGSNYAGRGIKKNGNLKGFLRQSVSALNEISSKANGSKMLSDIQSSEFSVDIVKSSGNSYTPESGNYFPATDGTGTGGTVKWSGKNYDGLGNPRPGFIGLGHELAHGQDAAYGTMDGGHWFDVTFDGVTKPVYNVEKYATHMENKLRAEHGVPLRTHYQPGYPSSRILVNGIQSSHFRDYNYIENVIRPSYQRILRGF